MHFIVTLLASALLSVAAGVALQQGRYEAGYRLGAMSAMGSPWPMPATYKTTSDVQLIDGPGFVFHATGHTCELLSAAFVRYHRIIFGVREPVTKADDASVSRSQLELLI